MDRLFIKSPFHGMIVESISTFIIEGKKFRILHMKLIVSAFSGVDFAINQN